MLDRQSKIILNSLIKLTNESNAVDDCSQIYSSISKYSKQQIEDSVSYMSSIGYISVLFAGDEIYQLEILYKGLHYRDFDYIKFKNFLMQGVVTPIFVSVITTLLALYIKGLLL